MVTVPAFVWRYGPILRGVIIGAAVAGFLGILAWIDSGALAVGLIAFTVLFVFYGGWMSRRMTRHWPSAADLTGEERERVAGAARRGLHIDDPRLVPALVDYRNGLREAVENSTMFRWLIWLVLVVAIGTAVFDGIYGSWGNLTVSVVYLVLFLFEVFWWPKGRARLLANADHAVDVSKISD